MSSLKRTELWTPRGNVEVRLGRANKPSSPGPDPDPGPGSGPTDLPGWKLDMVEDFNSINTSRWTVLENLNMSGHLERTKVANVTIQAGAVRQQAKIEAYGGQAYTSGFMYTQGKYTLPNYFRVEARCKVPWERGMWPAPVWFRPNNQLTVGSAFEIDLVESIGIENNLMHHTLHAGANYGADHVQSGMSYALPNKTDWHTYVLEKLPNNIKMYCDGALKVTYTNADTKIGATKWANAFEDPNQRWAIWSNLQIGGWGGNVPDGTTNWAADNTAMLTDYIYTWTVAP